VEKDDYPPFKMKDILGYFVCIKDL